ncbi:MAG: hypothetical protein QW842_05405 [Candidatus Nezhaarchaeales archaeon]
MRYLGVVIINRTGLLIEGSLVDMRDVSVLKDNNIPSAVSRFRDKWLRSGLEVVGVLPMALDHSGMYVMGYLNGVSDSNGAAFMIVSPDDLANSFTELRVTSDYLWVLEAIRGYPNLRDEVVVDPDKARAAVLGRYIVRAYATEDIARARIFSMGAKGEA